MRTDGTLEDGTLDRVRPSLWWQHRGRPAPVAVEPTGVLPPTADVLVVGGGLTGLCTAVLLARAGRQPVLVEARVLGAGTTGHSTAKLSLLQGDLLSRMQRHAGPAVVAAYVAGNRLGQEWLADLAAARGARVDRRDAVTWAATPEGARAVEDESQVARRAGLPVDDDPRTDLPFAVQRAVTLHDQVQVDPLDLVDALRAELADAGGTVLEGVRVTGASLRPPYRVRTTAGEVHAGHVVLATQTPVLDRSAHFARLRAVRSHARAYTVPDGPTLPRSMSLSLDPSASRSLRTSPDPVTGGELLLVGGEGHEVGRASSERGHEDRLERWTQEWFPGASLVSAWSAQDYVPARGFPYVAAVPGSDGRLLVATGYAKWGMTSAPMAAYLLTGLVTGRAPGWAEPLLADRPGVRDVASAAALNASTARRMLADRVARVIPSRPPSGRPPAGREGRVEGGPLGPTAVASIDGRTCRVSAVCPHLGGVVQWNDAEHTWDCPLHGSRFTAAGEVLEGPATTGLAPRD